MVKVIPIFIFVKMKYALPGVCIPSPMALGLLFFAARRSCSRVLNW